MSKKSKRKAASPEQYKRIKRYLKDKKAALALRNGRLRIRKDSRTSKIDRRKEQAVSPELVLRMRRSDCAKLRVQGLSQAEIARVLRKTASYNLPEGYNRTSVKLDLEVYLEHVHQGTVDDVKRMRGLELMRLDWLTTKIVQVIEHGTAQSLMRAIELALKISDQRAKLAGLNAPTQLDTRIFGDINISYDFDSSQYDAADSDPELFVEGSYEVVDHDTQAIVPMK